MPLIAAFSITKPGALKRIVQGDVPELLKNVRLLSLDLGLLQAGAGVKGGTVYGATDEFGARSVVDKVHIHDLHATILHALGFDHKKLTFEHGGRDYPCGHR